MRVKLQNIASRIFAHKKILFGVAVFVTLVTLLSASLVSFAHAFSPLDIARCIANPLLCALSNSIGSSGIGGAISNSFINGVGALLDGVVGTVALVIKGMAEYVAQGMQAAIQLFMEIPTSPSNAQTPQTIKDGWTFTQNLVNIIFILILTFIGLTTILRLQTYQLQKTLPSLIFMALLVNFSGVFVGFIVDIGNIFTNAFINAESSLEVWGVADIPLIPFGGGAAKLGTHIVEIVYYLVSTLVYFVVILLFGVRVLILWTLAILAPIAFAAYILPATKKYWTQWLQQLIQWSIIGIPISFTLMLAKKVMLAGAGPSGFGGLFDPASAFMNLAAPFTALFLLFFGITLSMQMAPAGAQGVINWGKKNGIKFGAWAAREGWRNIARGKTMEKLGANMRKRGQGIEVKADEQTRIEKLAGVVPGMGLLGRTIGRTGVARFGARIVGSGIEMGSKQANTGVKNRDEAKIAQAEKDVKNKGDGIKNFRESKARMRGPLRDTSYELGSITGEIRKGNKKGINQAIENGEITVDDIIRLHKNATENGNDDARELLERAFPTIKDRNEPDGVKKNPFGLDDKKWQDMIKDYSQKDITDKVLTTEDTLTKDADGRVIGVNQEFVNTLLEKGNRRLIPQILEKGDPEEQQALWAHIKSLGTQRLHDMGRDDILTWSFGPAATNLGMDAIPIDPSDPTKGVVTREYITQMQRKQPTREELNEQQARVTQDLTVQTQRLTPLQQQQTTLQQQQAALQQQKAVLQQQLVGAPNKQARRPIQNQLNENQRQAKEIQVQIQTIQPQIQETQRKINALRDKQRDARGTIRLEYSPIEPLEREAETLQEQIRQINAQPTAQRDYASRDALNQQLQRIRQEIGRKASTRKTTEQQIQGDLTTRKTRLEQNVAQLNARTQELQNLIQQAQAPGAALSSVYQQQLPTWEAELNAIPSQLVELDRQLQDVAAGLKQIEGIKIPEAPASLPKIRVDMPNQLQNLISNGKQTAEIIKEMTQRMQKSLQSIKDIQGDFDGVLKEMEEHQNTIAGLDQQEQAGTLTPELRVQRDELRDRVQGLAQSRRELGEEMQRQTEAAIHTKETIETRKMELEDLRKQIEPLQEEYESKKKEESREKKIKERQKKKS